jgi:hypothetical protein
MSEPPVPDLAESQPRFPKREFWYVRAEFTLDPGRKPKRSGYRPLWRIPRPGGEPYLVGLNQMELVDRSELKPGETAIANWVFFRQAQGHIEDHLKPGAVFEICDGNHRVGSVRVVEVVYEPER